MNGSCCGFKYWRNELTSPWAFPSSWTTSPHKYPRVTLCSFQSLHPQLLYWYRRFPVLVQHFALGLVQLGEIPMEFSSLSRSQPGVSTAPLSLVCSVSLLRVCLVPLSVFVEDVKQSQYEAPEGHRLSLVCMWTLSCWPWLSDCDHLTNSTKQSIHQTHISNFEIWVLDFGIHSIRSHGFMRVHIAQVATNLIFSFSGRDFVPQGPAPRSVPLKGVGVGR